MNRLLSACLICVLGSALCAADAPPADTGYAPTVVSTSSRIRVWVDQIGYRPDGRKLAIVASDAALPESLDIELRNAKTNEAVWNLKDNAKALTKFKGGQKDGDSGDFVSQLDFSGFQTTGRYYIAYKDGANWLRSYQFNIAGMPYRDAALAAWKGFYYNRADGDKPEKYAGIWNHGKAYMGPNQATEARVYKHAGQRPQVAVGTEILDPKTYDVRGAWWDAGDFNKYAGSTVFAHNQMLLAYELANGAPKDSELNIPESGNGLPDVLDEIRFGTEYIVRATDGTGAMFGRTHYVSESPPDIVKAPVQLTETTSRATMSRASALGYAAVVWRESKLDDAFAKKCQDEAQKSWDLMKARPHPWPADPKNPGKQREVGEGTPGLAMDIHVSRPTAAAGLFYLTGKKEYDDVVHEEIAKHAWSKGRAINPGDSDDFYALMWMYIRAKGADKTLVDNIKKSILATADVTIGWTGANRAYGMALRGYWWGSNKLVGATGGLLVMASQLTDDKDKKAAYLEAAEEYVHYLFGRNPLGMCFLTNMKGFGAEHSAMVMFHDWVGRDGSKYGAKYVGEGEGKIGPFPGFIVGGVNGGMKKYVEVLHWQQKPWEYTEPDIDYQSACCILFSAFTWQK